MVSNSSETVRPASVVTAVHDAIAHLVELGAAWAPNSPADYGRFLRADLEKWREVVAKSGAKFD